MFHLLAEMWPVLLSCQTKDDLRSVKHENPIFTVLSVLHNEFEISQVIIQINFVRNFTIL